MTEKTMNAPVGSRQLDRLQDVIHGPVLLPGDPGYDAERTGFQLNHPHRPAVLVAASGAEDVREAVAFAAANGMRVAVQASGHGLAAAVDDGLLITTQRMRGVRVDPRAHTARVEAGARWRDVIAAAAPHGLAPLSGSSPGVGAVSYTLGGGVGLLSRRYGFAADHVRALDVVTADGRARRVTAETEPDLFWALRGGGGNVAVVTAMEIALFDAPTIFGGGLYFDVDAVPGVLEAWYRWTLTVPDELTSAVAMLPFPDVPAVPEPLRGKHVAQVQVSFLGAAEHGWRLARPLRELGPRLRETLRELPFSESGAVFDEPDQPHAYRSSNLLVSALDAHALGRLPQLAWPSASAMCVVQLRHLGGALARAPEVAGAVGRRDAAYSCNVLSPLESGGAPAVAATQRELLTPFTPRALGRSLNFCYGELSPAEVAEGYEPATWRRLTELKRRYDPRSSLVANHAVPPVGVAE